MIHIKAVQTFTYENYSVHLFLITVERIDTILLFYFALFCIKINQAKNTNKETI